MTSFTVKERIAVEIYITNAIINEALRLGFSISVNDGEETTLKRSQDIAAINAALRTTDEDKLFFHFDGPIFAHEPGRASIIDGKFDCHGWIYLVYGNDGYDVISDYVANDAIRAIVRPADACATVTEQHGLAPVLGAQILELREELLTAILLGNSRRLPRRKTIDGWKVLYERTA